MLAFAKFPRAKAGDKQRSVGLLLFLPGFQGFQEQKFNTLSATEEGEHG